MSSDTTANQHLESKHFNTVEEIQSAIRKLERRIETLNSLKPEQVRWNDPRIHKAETDVKQVIRDIYGLNSPEYQENQLFRLGPILMIARRTDDSSQRIYEERFADAMGLLEVLLNSLKEKLEDLQANTTARAYDTFQGLQLNAAISEAAASLFKSGHYSEAIFEASKVLVRLVQEKSGQKILDGAALMNTVFSPNKPILKFPVEDPSNNGEQEGIMYLYKGAVMGIRNPKAHNVVSNKPDQHRALEYLAFISLLAERLDDATLMT